MNFKLSVVAAGLAAALMLSATGSASAAFVPRGAVELCLQSPEICRGGGASTVQHSDALVSLLKSVNRQVNGSIRFVAERAGQDNWQIGASRGDCEDFALTKRQALIKSGVPASSLRIMVTQNRRGMPHAVLVVKTSGGDYVLDNEHQQVVTIAQGNYRVVSITKGDLTRWSRG